VDARTNYEVSETEVEGILYLSSFGQYQIRATSPEALNDIIIAISQQEGEDRPC
jgi:hypothetical protein